MRTRVFRVDNQAGWTLEARQSLHPRAHDPGRPPVVLIPGYGMNDFIFRYHPRGDSLVEYLTARGAEVWTINMRGQGASAPQTRGRRENFGLEALALVDIPAALDFVLRESRHDVLDIIGCSLGASLSYGYLVHHADRHKVRAMVAMGGPLRWEALHPLPRAVLRSRRLAALVPIRGSRRFARAALPAARRLPILLSTYVTPARVNIDAADELVRTVENPTRLLNTQMAHWLQDPNLRIGGQDIYEGLARVEVPVLCVLGNADGIVPPATARSVAQAMRPGLVEVLEVGDDATPYAHADLFISDGAQETVFAPIHAWLAARR